MDGNSKHGGEAASFSRFGVGWLGCYLLGKGEGLDMADWSTADPCQTVYQEK